MDYNILKITTMETLLRGDPDESPNLLERPLNNVNLNINIIINTPDDRPTPLEKKTFLAEKANLKREVPLY